MRVSFYGQVNFLQYYWNEDGNPIRPVFEIIVRVINPETKIYTLREHVSLCYSASIKKPFNENVVKKIIYNLCDAKFMIQLPYTSKREFFGICSVVTNTPNAYRM